MALTLADQVASLKRGDHVCLLYESLDEQITAVAPYFQIGLQQDEMCLFVGDAVARTALRDRLASLGLDVEAAAAAGRLRLLDPEPVYLSKGRFEPSDTIAALRVLLADAVTAGFAGVRTAGDMSWVLHGPPGSDRVIEYESDVNSLLADAPFLGMCQYDRSRFQPALMRDVLRKHPIAVLGDKVCSNPYYEPQHLRGDDQAAAQFRWMISQLEQTRAIELGLQELNRNLESMVYAASHDLQEPIRMVRMHLDLIARHAVKLDAPQQGWLDQARRSSERLNQLVGGILEATLGHQELNSADVPLGQVIAEALEDLTPAVTESHAKVRIDELPTVRCDRVLFVRLFRNLIGNAIKFRRGTPHITIDATSTEDRYVIAVRDDGIGIPADWMPQVFGMFKRLHARDAYPGNGIGLATCRRIVELHHGRIWVESIEGTGSAFFIALPR